MKYIFLIILVAALLYLFLYYQNNKIDVTHYNINSDNIDDNIKIVHLSDLHSKPFLAVLDRVADISPDFIVITGDYINDRCKNKDKMLAFGKELLSIAPVFYITGNHERRLENFNEIMNKLSEIGFFVLLDEIRQIEIKRSKISILGLDENQASFEDYKARKRGNFEYKVVKPYFDELDKFGGFKIVLSHYPENFVQVKEMNYSQYDFDLQLSGHAHGGQFILPFIGPVFSPGQGIFPKFARGSFGERPKMIVSRGIGNAEFPFRLFNHPEIIVININN